MQSCTLVRTVAIAAVVLGGCVSPGAEQDPHVPTETSDFVIWAGGLELAGDAPVNLTVKAASQEGITAACGGLAGGEFRIRLFHEDGSIHDWVAEGPPEAWIGAKLAVSLDGSSHSRIIAGSSCYWVEATAIPETRQPKLWSWANNPEGTGRARPVRNGLSWPDEFVAALPQMPREFQIEVPPDCVPHAFSLSPPNPQGNITILGTNGKLRSYAASANFDVREAGGLMHGPLPVVSQAFVVGTSPFGTTAWCYEYPEETWNAAGLQSPDPSRYEQDLDVKVSWG